VVGTPTSLIGPGGIAADTLLGLTWTQKHGTSPIPIPAGHQPLFPKVAASSFGWDVLFFEASQRAPGGLLSGATLWFAHFSGVWTTPVRIADFGGTSVYAGFASELVSHRGILGLLLNFEGSPTAGGLTDGFLLITRNRSGLWSTASVPARSGPGVVTLSNGPSDSTPFLIGVIEPHLVGQRFRPPSLGLRLNPHGSPVWFGNERTPVRSPSAAFLADRVIASWSTSAERQTVFYSSTTPGGLDTLPTRRLELPVADGGRLVKIGAGAALFGLEVGEARKIRIWWLDERADAALRDSIVFPRGVFKYSVAKSEGELLYIAALQVPTWGLSGDPSMEIVNVAMRCGSPEPSKPL